MKNNIFKAYPKRAAWAIIYMIIAIVVLALFVITNNNFLDAVQIEKTSTVHIGRTIDGLQLFYKIVLAVAVLAFINHIFMTAWMVLNITFGINTGRKQVKWIAAATFVEFFLTFFVLGFVGDVMEYGPSWILFAILLLSLLIAPMFTKEIGKFKKGKYASLFELSQTKLSDIKLKN